MKTVVVFDYPDSGQLEVEIPPGWHRVWSGFVHPGDRYLHHREAVAGRTEWLTITFADLVERHETYDQTAWFTCVIRECRKPVGEPCIYCGKRPTPVDSEMCGLCTLPPGLLK